tara:strand:+ start:870 stop:1862 length:993 start_codon:yes stop_codon:yes gene_type:complete
VFYIGCNERGKTNRKPNPLTINRKRLKAIIEEELEKMKNEANPAHKADGTWAKKGKGKTYSLTKNALDDVGEDSELEVPARGAITSQGKIAAKYGMSTGSPDKQCGRLTIDGDKKKKTRSCKDYPKKYSELDEVLPALATAARVATKAGAVADKVGKVAGAVKTGADVVKKLTGEDEDDEEVKTEKVSTPGRKKQKKETEKRNRHKNRSDLVPRSIDSPSVKGEKLYPGSKELMSLARGIAETQADDEMPVWDKDGKLVAARQVDEDRGQLLQPADEIYIKNLIQKNVLTALKNTKQQVSQEKGGCRWADLMRAITDIETAQKGHKEPKG